MPIYYFNIYKDNKKQLDRKHLFYNNVKCFYLTFVFLCLIKFYLYICNITNLINEYKDNSPKR